MSMNLFFRSFTQQEIDEMERNHDLIDEWVDAERSSLATDVETAWDVLSVILDGTGILAGNAVDDALFNGCALMSAEVVKDQAGKLSLWTHEHIRERLRNLEADSDLYRLELYQEEEDDLLEQFDRLVAFYDEAAKQGLGAISYAA